ncbi:LamG domain-containing protein [Neolewinella persica]|uniref:LamG domain-containing protein n=1 Tax=Neolewinella persica TaxID=70998 RepID=UPI00038227A2|nr:LamG domain-containing protein [Neolewinella persica]
MKRISEKLFLTLALLLLLAVGRTYGQTNSLNFDGSDDDVTLSLLASPLGSSPTNFTTELWFRSIDNAPSPGPCPDGMRTLMRLSGNQFNLEIGSCNNQLYIGEYFGVGVPLPPAAVAPIVLRQWHHLRVDYDNGDFTIYLDCIPVHTISQAIPFGVDHLSLAEFLNTNGINTPRHWLGEIDEVRIWTLNPPITACAERFCPLAGTETGLLAHWDFEQGVGGGNNIPFTTIPDQSGNGNDGQAANFVGNGVTSNLVRLNAPLIFPALHGLNLTIRDYPYQTAPLTTICSGDPVHFTLDLNGNVPGPFSNVSVVWEYSDDGGVSWLSLNSPPFTDFQFPILPGVLTANCGPSPTGFADRKFRAVATVTEASTGRSCTYLSTTYDLRICCPVSPFNVVIAPPDPLCEGETVNLNISLISPDAWVTTPGPNTTVTWSVTDENGTSPLPAQNQNTAFSYTYTAPALSAPLDLCFTAVVTNCNGKSGTAKSCIRIDPEPECGLIDAMPLGSPQNLTLVSTTPHPTYEICPGDDAIIGIDPANPFDKCIPQWQYSFDQITWVNLGFSNTIQNTNILPSHLWPAGAARIFYRIECAPLSNPSGCLPCYSNLIEVGLMSAPLAGTITGSTRECKEDLPTTLMVSTPQVGVTYQWLHNGLPFGTGPSQTVTEAGCYWLEASNGCQTTVGNKHCLEVCETVAVLSCPLTPNDCARLGDPVTLSACDSYSTCQPSGPMVFAWYIDGVFQPAETTCTLTFTPPVAGSTIRVEVTDPVTGCEGITESTVIPCDF